MGREQVESASEVFVSLSLSLSRARSSRLISSRLSGAGARAGEGPCLAPGVEDDGSDFGSCMEVEEVAGCGECWSCFEVEVFRQRKGVLAEGRRERRFGALLELLLSINTFVLPVLVVLVDVFCRVRKSTFGSCLYGGLRLPCPLAPVCFDAGAYNSLCTCILLYFRQYLSIGKEGKKER